MMEYLFVLGRNPELSIAEIKNFFEDSNPVKFFSLAGNGMLASFENEIPESTIEHLGGTIAIGEVMASGSFGEIEKELEKKEIYFGEKKNFSYAIWKFSSADSYEKVEDYLKKRFKEERLKTTRKNLSGILNMQSGKRIAIPGSAVDEEFFIFSVKEKNFFGKIFLRTNYSEIEKRDMEKPVRREKLAISPRLAKIMINLSKVRQNQILVDPFCGIGSILQEALLRNVKVVGIDKDESAIESAHQNLTWGKFSKDNFKLINEDSSKTNIAKADVLVTEPDLGETLRKTIPLEKARKVLNEYESLIVKVLNNLKKNISRRIVFTAPYIKLQNGERVGCSIGKILSKTGLKMAKGFPIAEFRESQIVGRQMLVLER